MNHLRVCNCSLFKPPPLSTPIITSSHHKYPLVNGRLLAIFVPLGGKFLAHILSQPAMNGINLCFLLHQSFVNRPACDFLTCFIWCVIYPKPTWLPSPPETHLPPPGSPPSPPCLPPSSPQFRHSSLQQLVVKSGGGTINVSLCFTFLQCQLEKKPLKARRPKTRFSTGT